MAPAKTGRRTPTPKQPAPAPRPPNRKCLPPRCPPKTLAWSIPAGVLNSFWCDFFPCLVAAAWHEAEGCSPAYRKSGDPPALARGMNSDDILALLVWLEARMISGTTPGVSPTPGATPSSVALRRVRAIIHFLMRHKGVRGSRFPMWIAGTGGYDFILSDQGIELFMPDAPQGTSVADRELDLLRYYTFRQSGRPSLGIPGYMTGSMSLLSVDAPVGPSQVEVDPISTFWALGLDPSCAEAARLLGRWGVSKSAQDVISALVRDPAYASTKAGKNALSRPPTIPMTFDEYLCAMRPFRCWQVSGAVYRGIAAELPRIVATAWMEPPPAVTLPQNTLGLSTAGPFQSRFADPGDNGLRSLVRERLETALPDAKQMHFEAKAVANPPAAPLWDADDLMITNQGFIFPPLPTRPSLCVMLTQIAEGRAGNPVFTDSKRPEREG